MRKPQVLFEQEQQPSDWWVEWASMLQILAEPAKLYVVGGKGAGKAVQYLRLQLIPMFAGTREFDQPSSRTIRGVFPDVAPEIPSERVDEVRKRSHELTLEIERFKSQLLAARRSELSSRRQAEYLEAHNEQQLRCISNLVEANRALQAALIAHDAGRVCMHEIHVGVVTDLEGDEVAVSYEAEDGPIEQVYHRKQFVDEKLPDVGDKLEAHVIVARRPRDSAETSGESRPEEKPDDFPAFRTKRVSGPTPI